MFVCVCASLGASKFMCVSVCFCGLFPYDFVCAFKRVPVFRGVPGLRVFMRLFFFVRGCMCACVRSCVTVYVC